MLMERHLLFSLKLYSFIEIGYLVALKRICCCIYRFYQSPPIFSPSIFVPHDKHRVNALDLFISLAL